MLLESSSDEEQATKTSAADATSAPVAKRCMLKSSTRSRTLDDTSIVSKGVNKAVWVRVEQRTQRARASATLRELESHVSERKVDWPGPIKKLPRPIGHTS